MARGTWACVRMEQCNVRGEREGRHQRGTQLFRVFKIGHFTGNRINNTHPLLLIASYIYTHVVYSFHEHFRKSGNGADHEFPKLKVTPLNCVSIAWPMQQH